MSDSDRRKMLGLLRETLQQEDVPEEPRAEVSGNEPTKVYEKIEDVPKELRDRVTKEAVSTLVDIVSWLYMDAGPQGLAKALTVAGATVIKDSIDKDLFLYTVSQDAKRRLEAGTKRKGSEN